ncbi:MAG: lipopolysaccharide biosynthesis protein [Bacteroidales bacterium]|nr:lipopolysaccharide biosynthesis protein [Bacteroidales bacterium]
MSFSGRAKIISNTLMLYIRMLLILLVSLYTVRLLLNILGVIDYGIYNVVGSVVSMFSFISYSLSVATQRYFSFEIGCGNRQRLIQTFQIVLIIYGTLAIFLFFTIEVLGYWFLTHQLVIPSDRIEAAKWILHFSSLSFLITIMTIPFNAMIIAKERMEAFALISILEALLKLIAVYLLSVISADHLKTYSILVFLSTLLINLSYFIYCKTRFSECILNFFWDNKIFKSIISFAGWNFFGSLASVVNSQGINLLINIFFGPAINAARGIAYQANALVNQFVLNFSTALNPQITKLYAAKDSDNLRNTVFSGSKFSFFLVLIIAVPLLYETQFVLKVWLKTVPPFSILFFQLVVVNVLIDSLSVPFQAAIQATGIIRTYQTIIGGLLLMNLPLSYLFFTAGYPPQSCFIISIGISIIGFVARLFFIQHQLQMSVALYFKQVVLKIFLVCLLIFPFLWILKTNIIMSPSYLSSIGFIFVSVFVSVFVIYWAGFSRHEKNYLYQLFVRFIQKIKKQ